MRKTVLIAGNFSFPKGNAAGKRVLGLGYILSDIGYEVIFIGCEVGRKDTDIRKSKDRYEQFTFYNFNGNRNIKDILNINQAFSDFKAVIEDVGEEKIAFVMLYGSPVLAHWIFKVLKYGKKHNIPVIFDCVDWIEKSGFDSKVKNIIKYIDTNYMKRFLACKCTGVIAISNYLYEYYKKRGCKTIVIPPVGRFVRNQEINTSDSKIKFIYAGSLNLQPGINRVELKDRIDISIEIMCALAKREIDFVFDIYGIEKNDYLSAVPEHVDLLNEMAEGRVAFHGRVTNDIVCQELKNADFLILNRSVSKVTTAGFPSKIAESLCMGTPVLTNDTSDLRKYITDYKNGLIIDFDLEKAEQQIVDLCNHKQVINDMKYACNQRSVFSYHEYVEVMKLFTQDILNNEA